MGKLTQFQKDQSGNVGVMAGVAMTGILVAVGAAIDFSVASNNQSSAQNIADALVLAAAVKVGEDGNEKPMAGDAFSEGKVYTAQELGYDFSGLADGTEVRITFHYDMDANEVRTVVRGSAKTGFMSMMGRDKLDFSASSVAEFPGNDFEHPASIAMVIDNSNSMWYDEHPSAAWDQAHYDTQYQKFRNQGRNKTQADEQARQVPTGMEVRPSDTAQRIESLRDAFENFNDFLNDAVGDDDDQRYLRMGLIPFNHNFISSKQSRMAWGTVPQNKITGMRPSGETDTSRGLDKAEQWLRNEHQRYDSEIRDNLKRYVIMMTDGNNTNNRRITVNKPGSGLWRGQEQVKQKGRWHRSRPCTKRETRYRDGGESGRESYTVCVKWGQETKKWIPEKTVWRWREYRQPNMPSGGRNWKEIERTDRSRYRCDQFRERGWEVFSVGYALQPGIYQRNLPGRPPKEYWGISPDDVSEATDLLQYCATTPDHFILADDAAQLSEAFEAIGASIAQDSFLRIKS